MNNNSLIMTAVLVIVVGGAAFFGGMKYQQTKIPQNGNQIFNGRMTGARGGSGQTAVRQVVGTILSRDDNSVTIKLNDGSSKIVIISDSTNINKASQASKTELTEGIQIGVFGSQNSDGSVTAQSIQLNPIRK